MVDGHHPTAAGFAAHDSTDPLTTGHTFRIASNTKTYTAATLLRLTEEGRLALDDPLARHLTAEERDLLAGDGYDLEAITLRHVLSHTSGLGANISLSRDSLFAPGAGYYYSGIGFMYLQEVIEQVTGQSLEDVAQQLVFVPLGMSSSSFVSAPDITPRTSNGHFHAGIPALVFTVPFVVSLVLVGILELIALRIRTGQWRPRRRYVQRAN